MNTIKTKTSQIQFLHKTNDKNVIEAKGYKKLLRKYILEFTFFDTANIIYNIETITMIQIFKSGIKVTWDRTLMREK